MKKELSGFVAIGAIVIFIIALFLIPLAVFWIAYLIGIIVKMTIGPALVVGISKIGLSVKLDDIPLICATLAWFGGYFKNPISTSKNTTGDLLKSIKGE